MTVSSLRRAGGESGIALVVCLLAMMLLMAVGSALVMTSSVEARIAGNYGRMVENEDAAAAALERVLEDLPADAEWDSLLSGNLLSGFSDGAPGARTLADGSILNLTQLVNMANCGRTTSCTTAQMNAITAERPWGSNNPRWRLFAFAPLHRLLPASEIESAQYLVVLLADDPAENDGDPLTDGAGGSNLGTAVIALRAEAFGPGGAHSGIVATVRRPQVTPALAMPATFLSWHTMARLDHP